MGKFAQFVESITWGETIWFALWGGIFLLSVALLVLMSTRWGQVRPLSKCITLSVVAHLLLVGYAHMTQLMVEQPPGQSESHSVRLIEGNDAAQEHTVSEAAATPWDDIARSELTIPPPEAIGAEPSPAEVPNREEPLLVETGVPSDLPSPATVAPELPSAGLADPLPREISRIEPAAIEAPPEVAVDQSPTREESSHETRPPQFDLPSTSDLATGGQSSSFPSENYDIAGQIQRLDELFNSLDEADAALGAEDIPTAATNHGHDRTLPAPGAHLPLAAAELPTVPLAEESDPRGSVTPISPSPPPSEAHAMVPVGVSTQQRADGEMLPPTFTLRTAENREEIAERFGGSAAAEAGVEAALAWLAANQSDDGRWDADQQGAGRGDNGGEANRGRAGAQADTGLTGLALLALLGAGHSHYEGEYRLNVQHGLEFLLRSQAADGNLAGHASLYARIYCHGMASLALCEAYAVTGDDRILPFAERAIQYTIAAQDTSSGGWRYQPGDQGDTSQFGWQVMALRSAELAGIEVPEETTQRMAIFLESVTSGASGGLASYRPGERASSTMTAEALVCRLFLQLETPGGIDEASRYLLANRPGNQTINLYYWYYATLGLFQLQGEAWHQWNDSLQPALLSRQQVQGPLAGSWNPDTVWGAHGGRVYSTAMACLCLEVYYRYLPLYLERDSLANEPLDSVTR